METPLTELPDGSGCFTATILSRAEAMALPLSERPLNYRIPGDLYHAVWETVAQAARYGSFEENDPVVHANIVMDLCFKIAGELDKRQTEIDDAHGILDADESKIIRNAKDGYPEGREPQELTLAQRVQALCIYAADWKRWFQGVANSAGATYRTLQPGEKIEPGDEMWDHPVWKDCAAVLPDFTPGNYTVTTATVRRKINPGKPPEPSTPDPGEGYRLLQRGDKPQITDEAWVKGRWISVIDVPVPGMVTELTVPLRRKIV